MSITQNILECFDSNCNTKYIDDITNKDAIDGLKFSLFKAIWYYDSDNYYYCERLFINGKNGLKLGKNNEDEYRLFGFDIEAEDPRLVYFNGKLYIIFICLSKFPGYNRNICITEFDNWNPIHLRIRNANLNRIEKNWVPFVKNDYETTTTEGCIENLYFVYSFDPLVILKYDLNDDGFCDIVFTQNNIELPINTEVSILRGGSNLIHYKDNFYICGCHDRLYYKDRYNYFTRIVLLDVENWKLVYVSKPVMFSYEGTDLKTIDNTNILYHITYPLIQDPISISIKSEDCFIMTLNVCDFKTLLYEINVNSEITSDTIEYCNIGDIQEKVKKDILCLCDNVF